MLILLNQISGPTFALHCEGLNGQNKERLHVVFVATSKSDLKQIYQSELQ